LIRYRWNRLSGSRNQLLSLRKLGYGNGGLGIATVMLILGFIYEWYVMKDKNENS